RGTLPSGPPRRRLLVARETPSATAKRGGSTTMIRTRRWLALVAVAGMIATACSAAPGASVGLTKVKLQLQWVPQAQFAGEIAALKEGYYTAEGLDVSFLDGGPNVANITVGCATDGPEFTLGWVPKALVAVESGNCDLVSI